MFSTLFQLLQEFPSFGIIAVVTIIVALVSLFDFRSSSKGTGGIPGPDRTHPKNGNLDEVKKVGGVYHYTTQLHKKYGKVASFWWGQNHIVSVACPYLWKDLLPLFDRPREMFKHFEPILGRQTIQYKNGPEARQLRQLTDRSFTHEAIMNYYDHILGAVNKMANNWMSLPKGQSIPLNESTLAIAIEAIAKAGLGASKTFTSDEEVNRFRRAYSTCWGELEMQLVRPPPEAGSDREKEFEQEKTYIRSLIKNIVKEKRKNPDEEKLFIDSMIDCDLIDDQELEDVIMTFMIGGFHTTAFMMTWCTYYLTIHAEIQDKVYQELVGVLGEEEIQPMIASKLQYCQQVLYETLRCCLIAPWGARIQTDHDIRIGNYSVPKETPVLIPFGVVMHDPDIFPEPERFNPDRFSPENSKHRPPLAFQPFGFAGKRKCPAWRFAIAEGLVFLSVFFRRFKVELVEGQQVEAVHRFVTTPKEEIFVTVKHR